MHTYKKIQNILVGGAAFLCAAISIQAQSADDLWSAEWEVKLESAYGAFETRADDA